MLGRRTAAVAALVVLAACAQGQDQATTAPTSAPTLSSAAVSSAASSASSAATTVATSTSVAVAEARRPKGAKSAKKVSIKVLPQISQPGRKKASAKSAKTAVEVSVSPRRTTVVTLQVASGKKWKKVSTVATNKKGKYVFKASATRGGKAATYRAVVGKRASKSASTAAWLRPRLTDNFSGKKLGNIWAHQRGSYNPAGLRRCSKGSPRAVAVKSGTARLSVIKDTSRKDKCTGSRDGKSTGKFVYRLNGNISTQNKFSFRYGHAAARIKFPKEMGQHGAFWMMPQVHESGTVDPKRTGAEIDIIESFGARAGKSAQGLSSFTYHWKMQRGHGVQVKTGGYLKNSAQYLTKKSDTWWNAYHVYSVEWTPKEYIFRIDGKETWRSKAGVSGQPQYLALSMLSSDYELAWLRGDKKLPQTMEVDWVRVWETGR